MPPGRAASVKASCVAMSGRSLFDSFLSLVVKLCTLHHASEKQPKQLWQNTTHIAQVDVASTVAMRVALSTYFSFSIS